MSFLWISVCILGHFGVAVAKPTEQFDYHTQLLDNHRFMLYWNHNATHITFEIHANTNGYVGFGFSRNASMYPGDVMLAWVANGNSYIYDYHTTGHVPPVLDHSQDWKLLSANEQNGKMIVKAARKIMSRDSHDISLQPGNMNLIFAYHDGDPTSSQLTYMEYHGANRGVKSVNLLRNSAIIGK